MPDALLAVEPGRPGRRRRPRRRWRDGGSSVAVWDLARLGGAVSALGVGALGARAAATALPVETADGVALVIVWLALAVPVVLAFRRSRPRGLLRFRVVDLAYGVVFGILLRGAQGALEGLGGQPPAWPSTFTTGEGLPTSFVWQAATGTLVTPVVEEAFFRAVVLVSAYEVARRLSGRIAGAVAAVATSTALFAIAHQLVGSPDAVDLVVLASVGVVTGTLVTGTGRLWPAVAVHVVFNASGFAMIAVGTLLA